jgi:sarcosine oxidase subunit gamma
MFKPLLKESPLVRFNLPGRIASMRKAGEIKVWERAFCGHINLRGDANSPVFFSAVRNVLGFGLPLEANTVAGDRKITVFWLGPNEWLIVTTGERQDATATGLRHALQGVFSAVTEVSGGQTIIALQGENARELIAKGCPLDLHPREFGIGRCAQSHLAKAPILLRLVDDQPTFELIARRSFADYLWLWLEDASREYGLAVINEPDTAPASVDLPAGLQSANA